jgi:Spy/CpxP family protein refolding chaperone
MRGIPTLRSLGFAGLLALGLAAATAQTPNPEPQPGTQAPPTGPRPTPEERVKQRLQYLSQELNLSDDQKEKLKPILEDEVKQMRAVYEDTSLTPDQKRGKMEQIHKAAMPQIEGALTAGQKEKLVKIRDQAKERHQKRREPTPDDSPAPKN